jgi:hypothetical protein
MRAVGLTDMSAGVASPVPAIAQPGELENGEELDYSRRMERAFRWVLWVFSLACACGPNGAAPASTPATSTSTAQEPATPPGAPGTLALAPVQASSTSESTRPPENTDKVTGRLDPKVIQEAVRAHYTTFRKCYEEGLGRNAELKGRVSARFVIGRDGAVSNVSNGGSDLPDPAVVSCVLQAFYDIRFPPPDGGIVTVVYPIILEPG